jgi:tRNA (guanine37-N1)-methyltransferase
VDHRVVEALVDEELSIGDYVLTNGTIAAAVVVDAVVRLLPGVLGDDQSVEEESFAGEGRLLEAPHYTRPAEHAGLGVPPVLLSGNHGAIAQWRREQAMERTRANRPDLLEEQ